MAVAVAAGLAASAQADTIGFDPDGAGILNPTYQINGLGFGAGNVLAKGAIPLTVGSTFQVYFQTHLTSLTGPTAPPATPGLNQTFQITEVGTFTERVESITATPTGTVATFSLANTANDRINIYFNNAVTFNDAAGTGFTDGRVIASLDPTSFTSSQFTNASGPNLNAPLRQFNQTGAGNGTLAQSVQGTGSTGINNGVLSYDPLFFNPPTGNPRLVSSIFNANLSAIFDAVSPSLRFRDPNATPGVLGTILPVIGPNSPGTGAGAINGQTGPDFQFQVSGFTQSFSAVPEPGTVTMAVMGFGFFGVGSFVARRRRLRAAA